MRRFLISSQLFAGHVEVLYTNGLLSKIDFSESNTGPQQRTHLKQLLPAKFEEFETVMKGTKATVVEAAFEVSFDMFWNAYGKKINKARCLPMWNKMSKTDQVHAWSGIKKYEAYLKKENWRTKQDPENYLRNKTWENEY